MLRGACKQRMLEGGVEKVVTAKSDMQIEWSVRYHVSNPPPFFFIGVDLVIVLHVYHARTMCDGDGEAWVFRL